MNGLPQSALAEVLVSEREALQQFNRGYVATLQQAAELSAHALDAAPVSLHHEG